MIKKVIITIRLDSSGPEMMKKVKEDVQIVTKSDIFKVPVEATILSAQDFNKQQEQTDKSLINSKVRNRLADSINMGKSGIMANFKAQLLEEDKNRVPGSNANLADDDFNGSENM